MSAKEHGHSQKLIDDRLLSNLRRRCEEIKHGRRSELVTGLVVEGGGMRGVYSTTVLRTLHEHGLSGAFDHLFGASAGALNASCFLSGQCQDAQEVYLDGATNRRLVNYLRWGKIVDVDFLVDEVMKHHRRLHVDKVRHSPSTLHVVLTDCVTRKAHVVTNKDAGLDWWEVLRATMALPFLYNRPVTITGRTYMDGCVVEPVPLQRAVAAGCTDILVILTRSPSFRTRPGWAGELLERPLLRKYPPQIREVIRGDRARFNAAMEMIEHPKQLDHGVRLRGIYPSNLRQMVAVTTTHPGKLRACVAMAERDARRFLGTASLSNEQSSP